MNMCKDPELLPEPEALAKALREPLLKVFPPALLGRLVVDPVLPALATRCWADRAAAARPHQEARRARTTASRSSYGDDVVKLIVNRCNEPSPAAG